jgi:hypothetical protein
MTLSKSLISALGLTVALAFSAPMFAVTSANAAGTAAQTDNTNANTNNTGAPMKKHTHHKKPVHKKHKKTEQKKPSGTSY